MKSELIYSMALVSPSFLTFSPHFREWNRLNSLELVGGRLSGSVPAVAGARSFEMPSLRLSRSSGVFSCQLRAERWRMSSGVARLAAQSFIC